MIDKKYPHPYICTRCGYIQLEGNKDHVCTFKTPRISFYSQRYSKCISCVFNSRGSCLGKNGCQPIQDKLIDFYDSCPEGFWTPAIAVCLNCSELVINTVHGVTKCTKCGEDVFKKDEREDKHIRTKKVQEVSSASILKQLNNNTVIYNAGPRTLSDNSKIVPDTSMKSPPFRELIISRYSENLNWVNHIPENIDVITIYNKGKSKVPYIPDDRIRVIKLQNIGREAHTWAYHFISRWDTLAETTFLAQGDPLAHAPQYLDLLKYSFDEPTTLTSLYTIENSFYKNIHGSSIRDLNKTTYNSGMTDEDDIQLSLGKILKETSYGNHVINSWKHVFKCECPDSHAGLFFGYGAMYALPKESIKGRSINFYKKFINSQLTAYQAEGLWYYIFNDPEIWRSKWQ